MTEMDILSLIGTNRNYTLHSHTQFCDGRASMEAMAQAAVAEGMCVYGFTPHSPIPFSSPCNMAAESVEPYLEEVAAVRRRHAADGCRFLAGMEIDYINDDWGPSSPFFRQIPLDYSIGSVHFIPSQGGEPVDIDGSFENFRRKMSDFFRGDIDYVVETFYSQSMAMLDKGGFDILGHLDKVGQNAAYYAPGIEDGCHYRELIDEYIAKIIQSGIIVELNTKALDRHGRFFPGERWLPRLMRAGVSVVVNSDAHCPDGINAGRAGGFALIDAINGQIKNE